MSEIRADLSLSCRDTNIGLRHRRHEDQEEGEGKGKGEGRGMRKVKHGLGG